MGRSRIPLISRNKVGLKRWSAVAIGFIGVLIVLRPGFRELSIGHLGAVIGGLGGAISIVVYRAAGPSEKNILLYGAGVLGTLFICGFAMIPSFALPTWTQMGWLAGYGILCAVGNILLMMAAFRAPAAMIGPTQYSQMLWAILIDTFVFHIHLELPMLLGIILIVGSGVLTLWREKARGTPLPLPHSVAADGQGLGSSDEGEKGRRSSKGAWSLRSRGLRLAQPLGTPTMLLHSKVLHRKI